MPRISPYLLVPVLFGLTHLSSLISLNIFEQYNLVSSYFFLCFGSLFSLTLFIQSFKSKSFTIMSLAIDLTDVLIILYTLFLILNSLMVAGYLMLQTKVWIGLHVMFVIYKYRPFASWENLIQFFIATGWIECAVAGLQFLGLIENINSSFTIGGTFGNPNVLAIYLTVLLPMCLTAFLSRKTHVKTYKRFLIASLVFFSVLICVTECRSAIISMIIIAFFTTMYQARVRKFRVFLVFISISILIPISFFLYQHKKDSADGRMLVWKVSSQMILKKPVSGYGYGNFEKEYNSFQADYLVKNPDYIGHAGYISYSFNEFLQEWVEGGILGLVLFSSFFIISITRMFKLLSIKGRSPNNKQEFFCALTLTTLCFISLVNYTTNLAAVMNILVFCLAGISSRKFKVNISPTIRRTIIVGLPFIVFFVYNISKETYHQIQYKKATLFIKQKVKKDKTKQLLKEAYPYLKHNHRYLYTYATTIASDGKFEASLELLKRASEYTSYHPLFTALGRNYQVLGQDEQAEFWFRRAASMIPSLFEPRFVLFNYYLKNNRLQKAKDVAIEIKELSVKIPSKRVEEIKNQINIFLTKQ